MNKKENHSAKSEIEQALLRLMTQKSYLDITVTDIVQEAKVARVSFYRNFTSISEVLDSIHKVGADRLKGVFHSFTGTTDELEEIGKLKNFKLGINGVITFKNSKLSETIQCTDINHIVLETDAPYLAPAPYRGRRNEPVYIWKTAEKVADTFGLTLDETVQITRKNALNLFKIPNKKA